MLVPLRGWMMMGLITALLILSYYRAYDELPIPTSNDERVRTEMAQRWAQKVASEIKRFPSRATVAVAPVVHDSEGILTDQLRTWVGRRNVIMRSDSLPQRLNVLAGLAENPKTIAEAVEPLLNDDLDFIVAAKVEDWTTFPEFEATLEGLVEFRDGATGQVLMEFRLALADQASDAPPLLPAASIATSSESAATANDREQRAAADVGTPEVRSEVTPPFVALRDHNLSAVLGFGLWLGNVLGFPLILARPLSRALARKDNQINLRLLLAWVLATGILAVVLWVRHLEQVENFFAAALAIAAAAVYFGYSCQQLEKMKL